MSAPVFKFVRPSRRRPGDIRFDVDLVALIAQHPNVREVHERHIARGYKLVSKRKRAKLRRDGGLSIDITWRKQLGPGFTEDITQPFGFTLNLP